MSSMVEEGGVADSPDFNITLQTHTRALRSDTLTFEVANQLGLEKRPEFRLMPPWYGQFFGRRWRWSVEVAELYALRGKIRGDAG